MYYHDRNRHLPDSITCLHSLQVLELGCFRQEKSLFQPVSFHLAAGSGIWIKGPNGIGKSSLLRLIAGLATGKENSLRWNDDWLETNKAAYLAQLHYLGHTDGLRTGLTVMENLQLAATLAQQTLQQVAETIATLQLDSVQHTQIQHLSAGQKRRAALARFFMLPRALWILDEPLTSLDADTQQMVTANINAHLQQGGLCILTSHQPLSLQNFMQLELTAC